MFGGLDTLELTAFAVSHVRNDIALPTDLAIELGLRGLTSAHLASAVALVVEVEAWDAAYDLAMDPIDVDDVIDADFDEVAIGGTY
jgi:hypothetical protein